MKQELFNLQDAANILRYSPGKLYWIVHTAQISHVRDRQGRVMFEWHDLAIHMIERSRHPLDTRRNFR